MLGTEVLARGGSLAKLRRRLQWSFGEIEDRVRLLERLAAPRDERAFYAYLVQRA